MEDSWFWESEQTTVSSASSKDNENASSQLGSGGDLTIIPLDTHGSEMTEKLRRLIDEKDQKLKKIKIENAILNEKVNQLSVENKEINKNIEDLDKEHGYAIEELLSLKKSIQDKCTNLEKELKNATEEHQEFQEIVKQHNDLKKNYGNIQQSYADAVQDNLKLNGQIDFVNEELKRKIDENIELLAAHDEKEKELLEKFEYVEIENKEKSLLEEINKKLENELQALKKRLQIVPENEKSDAAEKENSKVDLLKAEVKELKNKLHTVTEDREKLEVDLNNFREHDFEKAQQLLVINQNHQTLCEKYNQLENNYQNIKKKYANHNEEVIKKEEEYELLKTEASESETRLVQENVVLQKQVIDLQSCINNKSAATGECFDSIKLNVLRALVEKYESLDSNNVFTNETFLNYFENVLTNIATTRVEIEELTEQLNKMTMEKNRHAHEKQTVQADLHHYEIEVAELMKNNEILLTEIDNLKTGKLQTISEQNEDNIIILEKQLDECNNLNQNLESEYQDMQNRLTLADKEKDEILFKINEFESLLNSQNSKLKESTLLVEHLELEKSNLLFELNELKTDDSKTILEVNYDDAKQQIKSLQLQLDTLNIDHSDLIGKLQTLQTQSIEIKIELEKRISDKDCLLIEKDRLIEKKADDIRELLEEVHFLKNQIEDTKNVTQNQWSLEKEELNNKLTAVREALDAQITESKEIYKQLTMEKNRNLKQTELVQQLEDSVKTLEEKLLKNDDVIGVVTDDSLQRAVEIVEKEKNDLIQMITAKHQENVQYHTEIQRLSQLLTIEMAKSQNCTNCTQLAKKIDDLKSSAEQKDEKNMDQITFLREKSDILSNNLLHEKNNQKMLIQEKQELFNEKQMLVKDLERLREHLLEIEEAHTQESVELQKLIEEKKVQMTTLEEDAKKSSTAFTSAR